MGKYQILTGTSTTTSDVQAVVSKKADKPVLLGQTRIILFSEKMVHENRNNRTDRLSLP
ncbi:hypothetical protein RCO48_34445 [Peribacillus frigoritolerans]|nr:hypothetical protein [Peribacillus frigoritolerans]